MKDLEHKHLIRILKEPDLNSYSPSGEPISNEDFGRWIDYSENFQTVALTEAKPIWAEQKKKLQKDSLGAGGTTSLNRKTLKTNVLRVFIFKRVTDSVMDL